MGAYGAVRGMPWPLSLGLGACGVMVLMALGRPLYKAAVYRTGAREILCRYIPWYQAVPLASSVIFPIIGITAIGMGNESDSPSWLLFAGYFLLILGLVFAASALLAWIANRLVLTPTSVGLKIIFRGRQEIPRENVRAITATMGRNGATGAPRLHVEFTYAPPPPWTPNKPPVTRARLPGSEMPCANPAIGSVRTRQISSTVGTIIG
jgi:hypothetical protein